MSVLAFPTFEPERPYEHADPDACAGLDRDIEARNPSTYSVLILYSGAFDDIPHPPPRHASESEAHYRARCVTAERVRRERRCYEGIHVIRYDVPPDCWRARDLEQLLRLVYLLLPNREPQWGEAARISQELFTVNLAPQRSAPRYCLKVARGDYAGYLRLPLFPTHTLADWLGERCCRINLLHSVARLEHIEPIAAGRRTPSP